MHKKDFSYSDAFRAVSFGIVIGKAYQFWTADQLWTIWFAKKVEKIAIHSLAPESQRNTGWSITGTYPDF